MMASMMNPMMAMMLGGVGGAAGSGAVEEQTRMIFGVGIGRHGCRRGAQGGRAKQSGDAVPSALRDSVLCRGASAFLGKLQRHDISWSSQQPKHQENIQ